MTPHLEFTPHFWRTETSGVLAPVVERYLKGEILTPVEIAIMRTYLRQWIMSPAWDANPAHDDFSRAELASLRADAALIATQRDIERWLAIALEMGIDPL